MKNFLKLLYSVISKDEIERYEFIHYRNKRQLKAMIWKLKSLKSLPLAVLDVGLQYRVWELPLAVKIITNSGYAVLGTEYSRIEVAKGEADDIINAIKAAYENFDFLNGKTLLIGISMGGAVMLKIASIAGEKLNVIGVIAVAPFSDLSRAFFYAKGFTDTGAKSDPRIKLLKLYQKYAWASPFKEPKEYDLRSPINFVHKINCPVYLIHGEKDTIVTIDHSIEIYHKMLSYGKKVNLRIVPGEGIHTPLLFSEMLKKFNFYGFSKTWLYIQEILQEINKSEHIVGV